MERLMDKILAVAPHTDDVELGCGGTVAKMVEQGAELHYVALSDCRGTLIGHFPEDKLELECRSACEALGIPAANVHVHHLNGSHFYAEPRNVFDRLEELRDSVKPDLVLIPSLTDTHEDHKITAQQAIIVFRRGFSILAYEQPWNNLGFCPTYFVGLTEQQFAKKVEALSRYETQFHFNRPYMAGEFNRSLARTRAMQMGGELAEAFEVVKWIA
jgi:N-acetylglucosamine malate deacetylase 1